MDPIIRKETLFDGLNADEQRRLYFLLLGIDQLEPREALALAERIDAFVTAKSRAIADAIEASLSADRRSDPVSRLPERPDGATIRSGDAQPPPDKMQPSPQRLGLKSK